MTQTQDLAADLIDLTIADLQVGDVMLSIDGKPRPFPYHVTKVITTQVSKKVSVTQVRFAHGGIVPPCSSKTTCTIAPRG